MDPGQAAVPFTQDQEPASPSPNAAVAREPLPRWFAALQVVLVCGIPTQIVIFLLIAFVIGVPFLRPNAAGTLDVPLELLATVSFLDTATIALLIRFFLALSGENSSEVFVGRRKVSAEFWRGLALVPVVFFIVVAIVVTLRTVAPWLHNVTTSPLEAYMDTPFEAAIFIVIVILAGGVREELQRAFILHRFEQRLGGIRLGLVLFTLTFGLLHLDQGFDVAIAVGFLGLLWGLSYMKRRSAVLAMTNHAAFNTLQVVQVLIVRSMGA